MISKTQYINISVTRLLCSLCKLDFLPNSSSDWTWEKCILLAHKELNLDQEQWGHPQDGEEWKFPWNMQRYVVNVSAALSGQLFPFSFLKSVFLHYFSSSLFLVVNDREKENVVVCSEISSFLRTAAATGMEELWPFLCSTLSRAKWFSSWTRQSVWVPYSSLTFPLQLGFPLMLREWACFQFSVVKGIFSIWWI